MQDLLGYLKHMPNVIESLSAKLSASNIDFSTIMELKLTKMVRLVTLTTDSKCDLDLIKSSADFEPLKAHGYELVELNLNNGQLTVSFVDLLSQH